MKILALTGSIGVGKTTLAHRLMRMGIPCFNADAEIHKLLGPSGKAVYPLLNAFDKKIPNLQNPNGSLRRSLLADYLTYYPVDFDILEAILHPLVYQAQKSFLFQQSLCRRSLVVLDIPLLLEKGWDQYCDMVIVLTAPDFLRRKRVLSRQGMNRDRFAIIESRQWSATCKCLQADRVIPTGAGFRFSMDLLRRAVRNLKMSEKTVWTRHRITRRFNPIRGKWITQQKHNVK